MTKLVLHLTPKQEARQARDKDILSKFKLFRDKFPDASLERIFAAISKDYNMTNAAIWAICKRNNAC